MPTETLIRDRLCVHYTDAAGLQTLPAVMGVVGFDAPRPPGLDPAVPFARIAMPALDGRAYEVWCGAGPVRYGQKNGVATADDGVLCFSLIEGQGGPIRAEAETLYRALLAVADGAPVLRFWNYLPAITASEGEDERYRLFNQGRHAAFAALRPEWQRPPAASALGTHGGVPLAIMLTARVPGTPIENPRQVSAYRYPAQYGPVSPSFSRALVAEPGLFISGTASIIGHESQHEGDVAAQIGETIRNVQTLLDEAGKQGFSAPVRHVQLKAYLRNPADQDVVRNALAHAFPDAPTPIFLHADICRPELLVEVEAFAVPV